MSLIDSIFTVANEFTKDPKHVHIDEEKLGALFDIMNKSGKVEFGNKVEKNDDLNYLDEVKLELLASAINYCYWYGKHDVRPGGSSSTLMYSVLVKEYSYNNRKIDLNLIENIISRLAQHRMPLIEDRAIHLEEAYYFGVENAQQIRTMNDNLEDLFDLLVTGMPGFASDLFLKRACLFFIQLNRKFNWFSKDIGKLPIPADYQIPKLLRHFEVLKYSKMLEAHVDASYPLPKGSLMECEIRASSIIACRKLATLLGWNDCEVDTWLFLKRKESNEPFHLTVTTDY